jgi:pyruvate dehydrogenase E1 component alpha subunit
MAAKIKKDPLAVVTYFGDGATSEGDFHEGLTFAGVFQVPAVLVCQNNQWAISTPLEAQTHSATLAQKAVAYGIEGLQVDGNDVLAVYHATDQALRRARQGKGPTLMECLTYRMGAHTTSDDPSRYREDDAVQSWVHKDPIDRFEKYLLKKGVLREGERKNMAAAWEARLKDAASEAESILQRLTPGEMFTYLYKNMPDFLKAQMEEAMHHYSASHREGVVHG